MTSDAKLELTPSNDRGANYGSSNHEPVIDHEEELTARNRMT